MTAFGMLLILVGLWVIINAIKGNFYQLIPGPVGGGGLKLNTKNG